MMLKQLCEIYKLLTDDQKKRFFKIQLFVIVMSLFEVIGISSIGPFMAAVGDIDLIIKNSYLLYLYNLFNFSNPYDFLFVVGVLVLGILFISSLFSMYTTWKLARFAFDVGTELADRLYRFYLSQSWLFHCDNSSSHLIKQISTESNRVTTQVILPAMHMNARLVLVFFISIGLFIYNPVISLLGLTSFLFVYVLLFRSVKKRLSENGKVISENSKIRFRLMTEGFGGIKDIILLKRVSFFVDDFICKGRELSKAGGVNNALAYAPRYLMELLSFGVMVLLVLYLLKREQGNLGLILPILGVFGLAAFKLLPALQNIYGSISEIKANLPAFDAVKQDLIDSSDEKTLDKKQELSLVLKNKISLKNISFKYPGKNNLTLSDISLEIKVNQSVGLVGSSGSGKSTLVDLMMGLLKPEAGSYKVDDVLINDQNIEQFQDEIGFVSQNIFLTEGTIAENIAFGINAGNVDYERLDEVSKMSRLDEFISGLEQGYNTTVGERGVQLSGGQRQRIGIARALYNNASILFFDEATSALDGVTERHIMDSINDLHGKKTIILIAHRLKTIEKCDVIYFLENGKVRNSGSFDFLIKEDEKFRVLASLS